MIDVFKVSVANRAANNVIKNINVKEPRPVKILEKMKSANIHFNKRIIIKLASIGL